MTISPELRQVAERVIWFESADEALQYPNRFLAFVMTFATLDEILIVRRYFSDDAFRSALADPPPGVFDFRSWTYWNLIYGRRPVPPMPQRQFPSGVVREVHDENR